MLTDEIFWKMDLRCVFSNGEISEIEDGFYVYLIVNEDKYYVGLSKRLKSRITEHSKTNTNNICDDGACVYILEKLDCEKHMRIMEYLWIVWFCLNTECVNIEKSSHKIRAGKINKQTINWINSNYKLFCDFEYINELKLLKNQTQSVINEIEYFGKTL
tara:strand:+ start:80 stop:556 length:477 start_codon:yes stop_codon:yes gene_type:complete